MYRFTLITSLFAAGLAGCAGSEPVDSDGADSSGNPEVEDGEEDEGESDDGTHESDEIPDTGLEPQPTLRITWLGQDGEDFLVRATVSDAVRAYYSTAEEYRIRLDASERATYVEIVDADLERVEILRTVSLPDPVSAENGVQVCYPFPIIPPIVGNCFIEPCPWDGFPGPDGLDCMTFSGPADGEFAQITGSVGPVLFEREIWNTADGIEIVEPVDGHLGWEQQLRLQGIRVVLDDVRLGIMPELEPLDWDCAHCLGAGLAATGMAVGCVFGELPMCVGGFATLTAFDANCKGACAD